METRKDGHIVWEKVDRSHERDTFEKIAGLDAICFDDRDSERLSEATEIFGDIYALWRNEDMVGYAIYGQVWLPDPSRCLYLKDRGAPRLPTTRVRTQDTRSNPL